MLKLRYTFTKDIGPSYYSEYTDEDFCDVITESYDYSIGNSDIIKGLINLYTNPNTSLRRQLKDVVTNLDLDEEDLTEKEINETIKKIKEKNIYTLLITLFDDIDSYLKDSTEEDLKDYYELDAYEEYLGLD